MSIKETNAKVQELFDASLQLLVDEVRQLVKAIFINHPEYVRFNMYNNSFRFYNGQSPLYWDFPDNMPDDVNQLNDFLNEWNDTFGIKWYVMELTR